MMIETKKGYEKGKELKQKKAGLKKYFS